MKVRNLGLEYCLPPQKARQFNAYIACHFLFAISCKDSSKPSILYMHQQMQLYVSPASIDETNIYLGHLLEGTPPADAYFFAYMSSLGVSWGQLRILISALKLWCNCNLDPTWEIMQRGPVRSMFRSSALDYLRQRLQVCLLFTFIIFREMIH